MMAARGSRCRRSMARILAAVTMVMRADSTTVTSTMSNGPSARRDIAASCPTTEATSSADCTRAQACSDRLALSMTRTLRASEGGSPAKHCSVGLAHAGRRIAPCYGAHCSPYHVGTKKGAGMMNARSLIRPIDCIPCLRPRRHGDQEQRNGAGREALIGPGRRRTRTRRTCSA